MKKSELRKTIREEIHKVNETIDKRYLQIKIKNIKSDLDAIQHWFDTDNIDKVKEYIDDQIKVLKDLKKRI